ncbi:MAG: 4-hydroxy-3-methylbut-2-enyl diphosphate reductase [Acidimicrobiales bacterium]|nr:4-hydroxy-3-methylbut-2-enyl diphosphate reductase [Acidimicrobiales bacterium]
MTSGAGPNLLIFAPLRLEASALGRGAPSSRVVRTGGGARRARRAAAQIEAGQFETAQIGTAQIGTGQFETGQQPTAAVAIAGFCGGLDERLSPGDVIVASELMGPGSGRVPLPSAALLGVALRRRGLRVHQGPLVTVDHLVRGAERRELAEQGALAVDMESGVLAPALVAGAPLAVVRVVVDTPARELLRPGTLRNGLAARAALRSVGAALSDWAPAVMGERQGGRRVLLASPRSFCAGVDRAIATVEEALGRFGPPVYVRRQIVHNTHVVADLESKGAVFVEELDEVPEEATVVLAAHGVAPTVRAQAEDNRLRVIDATCPLVAKVHHEARRFAASGHRIVLIGHHDHEEVQGTLGEADDAISVVASPAEVDDLDLPPEQPVAFLTQTTLALDDVRDVVERLRARRPDAEAPAADDVCYASQNRQDAVREVAHRAEVLLVVGSPNSSNSNRLAEVAEREGCRAHLVEDETEVDPAWLAGARVVGVTAGASAPEVLVDRVVAAISGLGPITVEEVAVTTESGRFALPRMTS